MAQRVKIDFSKTFEKGLKLMSKNRIEEAIHENYELLVADKDGKPIRIKAKNLKALSK